MSLSSQINSVVVVVVKVVTVVVVVVVVVLVVVVVVVVVGAGVVAHKLHITGHIFRTIGPIPLVVQLHCSMSNV